MWLWVTFDFWSKTQRVIWRAQQEDLQLVCKTLQPSLTVIIHFSLQRDYLVRLPCIQSFRTTICFEAWRARLSLLDAVWRDLWDPCEWDKSVEWAGEWKRARVCNSFLINFERKFHFIHELNCMHAMEEKKNALQQRWAWASFQMKLFHLLDTRNIHSVMASCRSFTQSLFRCFFNFNLVSLIILCYSMTRLSRRLR